MKAPSIKAAVLASAILLGGCATQAEQACQNGQALAGQTLSDTCLIGQSDRARINGELWTAAGVAVVGLAVAGLVIDANRTYSAPSQTVIVNQTATAQTPIRPMPVQSATALRPESAQAVLTPVGPIWGVKE